MKVATTDAKNVAKKKTSQANVSSKELAELVKVMIPNRVRVMLVHLRMIVPESLHTHRDLKQKTKLMSRNFTQTSSPRS